MRKYSPVIALAAILVFAACSKDDNPTAPTGEAPQYQVQTITLPQQLEQSSNPHAQTLVSYMRWANIFASSMTSFIVPPDGYTPERREGALWEYNWKQDALDILLRIQEEQDKFSWVAQFNGKDTEYDYYNWIAFRATQSKDAKSGSFTAYLPNTTIVLGQYTWSIDDAGALHFKVTTSALQQGGTFIGVVNPDKSGSLEIYKTINGQDILIEKYQWNADGSGQWWVYENGEVKDSGSWS